MARSYKTEARAFQRVKALQFYGFWPGVRKEGDRWVLTYDPLVLATNVGIDE